MKKEMKFHGWDISELYEYFDIEPGEWNEKDLDGELRPLKTFLSNSLRLFYGSDVEKAKFEEIILVCRAYLNAFIDLDEKIKHSYGSGIFKELAKIEEPEAFLHYYIILLPCMWV